MSKETQKPGNLPEQFYQMGDNPFRDQFVDQHLTRDDVADRIADLVGFDREDTREVGFTHQDLATLAAALADTDQTPAGLRRKNSKNALMDLVADAVDADISVDDHQSEFRKNQLVRIFLTLFDQRQATDGDVDEQVVA